MIPCARCGKILGEEGGPGPRASISGSVMGDEITDSFFFCDECRLYTVEIRRDRFLGPEEVSHRGPLLKEEGEERIRLIEECPEPWNKTCGCPAHKAYFEGWLD